MNTETFIIITGQLSTGEAVYFYKTPGTYNTNGTTKTTTDIFEAKRFLEADVDSILNFMDTVFSKIKTLKLKENTIKPIRIKAVTEDLLENNFEFKDACKDRSLKKLNLFDMKMLGLENEYIMKKLKNS